MKTTSNFRDKKKYNLVFIEFKSLGLNPIGYWAFGPNDFEALEAF